MRTIALLLLATPLALAACGGGSPAAQQVTVDPAAYVRDAASKTAALSSEHMTMSAKMNTGATSMRLTLQLHGSGDYSNSTREGLFVLSAGPIGNVTEVLAGKAIYLSSPLMTHDLPAGKTWVKVDLANAAKANHGVDISALMARSPTQALQQVEAAGTVTKVGTETIDGAPTTHYRVENLDLAKLPEAAKLAAVGHVTYGPIDVWIGDEDGNVHRETMSFGAKASGQSVSMNMALAFSKFGEKVNVTVPPASKVANASVLPGYAG
ncbi:MAG TPA: LppX_LprAFG lipoprotein [Gaiellaceae bacterium]|jgi:hypothetical protein